MTNQQLLEQFADVRRSGEKRMSITPRPETIEKWIQVSNEVLELYRERDVNEIEAYFVTEYLLDYLRGSMNLAEVGLRKETKTQ